jgi:hypothetical protein
VLRRASEIRNLVGAFLSKPRPLLLSRKRSLTAG